MKKLLLAILILFLFACSPAEEIGEDGESAGTQPSGNQNPSSSATEYGDIAMTVGGIEISNNEYRYHFYSEASVIISYYGSFMEIDPDIPYDEQYIDETTTWADAFSERAVAGIRNAVILSEQAKKSGMTLDASFEEQIEEQIDMLNQYYESSGITMESLLNSYFGGTIDEQKLRDILERVYLGYQFELSKRDSVDVSDKVLLDYYNANTSDFDRVDYIFFEFGTSEEADACVAAVTDEQSFYSYIKDNHNDDLNDYQMIGEINKGDEFSDWLFDDARNAGDVTVLEAYEMYYVLYFKDRYQPADEKNVSVRHILISNDGMTDEQARAQAEELYEEWINSAATEDSFAAMAAAHSQDPGSIGNGGLYENVYQGQMVVPFDEWCFDPNRRAGDSGLVDTNYGTHIMYFTGDITYVSVWKDQLKQIIIENAYAEFYEALMGDYEVELLNTDVSK